MRNGFDVRREAYRHGIMRSMTKVTAVTLMLLALAVPQAAVAHTGGAVFEVLEATSREPRIVEIRVVVTYSSDHERAETALLHAVGHGPNGRATGPIEFTRGSSGEYRLRTTVPTIGTWRFDITSRFPPGSTAVTVKVGDRSSGDNSLLWFGLPAAAMAVTIILVLRFRRRSR